MTTRGTLAALAAALTLSACGSSDADQGKRYDCPDGSTHAYYTEHDNGAYYMTDDGRKVAKAGELARICD